MLQHNPHSHSILCHQLGETLDGHQTREVEPERAMVLPCTECRCQLTDIDAKPAAKTKAAK